MADLCDSGLESLSQLLQVSPLTCESEQPNSSNSDPGATVDIITVGSQSSKLVESSSSSGAQQLSRLLAECSLLFYRLTLSRSPS